MARGFLFHWYLERILILEYHSNFLTCHGCGEDWGAWITEKGTDPHYIANRVVIMPHSYHQQSCIHCYNGTLIILPTGVSLVLIPPSLYCQQSSVPFLIPPSLYCQQSSVPCSDTTLIILPTEQCPLFRYYPHYIANRAVSLVPIPPSLYC
jgi:hypothetical protein